MPLETTECISIENKGRAYTDCMEFSLLRFLHLLGHCPSTIGKSGSCDYSKKVKTGLVGEFIRSHGLIWPSGEYYLDQESPGVTERADWAEFVSDRDFLHYYRNDGAELFTSVENIIRFFNGFYSMDLDTDESAHKSSLKTICEKFSTDKVCVQIQDIKVNKTQRQLSMREICRMISRPDDQYNPDNSIHKVQISNTQINFYVGDTEYIWRLYEVFLINPGNFSNKYITGHSVIELVG